MTTKTYDVYRAMFGDGRDYVPGDTRELTEADAAPLVALGALAPKGEPPVVAEPGVRNTFGFAESSAPSQYITAPDDLSPPERMTVQPIATAKSKSQG